MRITIAILGLLAAIGWAGDAAGQVALPESVSDAGVFLPAMGIRVEADVVTSPTPVRASGRDRLFYELRISSFDPRVFRLDSIGVISGAGSNYILRLRGDDLREAAQAVGSSSPLLIEAGRFAFFYFGFAVDSVPESITHTLWLSHRDGSGEHVDELRSVQTSVDNRAPLLIDPPLRGRAWYSHAGPAIWSHHRRTLVPRTGRLTLDSRYATDWVQLAMDSADEPGEVNGPDWKGTLGQPVYAAHEGVVVAAMDGIPDDPIGGLGESGVVIDWETIGGNHVVVQVDGGLYMWYEHLLQGSVALSVDQRVERGDRLGRVGNSGNASRPHLHFEITDSNVRGHGEGFPYRFRCFAERARIPNPPNWDDLAEGEPGAIGLRRRLALRDLILRENEIALGGTIVDLPPETQTCTR